MIFVGSVTDADKDGYGPFQFKIEEPFKGIKPGTSQIKIGMDFVCGGIQFELGRRYLVIADSFSEGYLEAFGCGGSSLAEDAADAIDFYRAAARGLSVTRIQGRTAVNSEDSMVDFLVRTNERSGLAGVKFTALKDGQTYQGLSEADGLFRIPVPGPGTYILTAADPGYASSEKDYPVEVRPGSCAELNIGMWTASRISGQVVDRKRQPVAGIPVSMRLIPNARQFPEPVWTDSEGRFEFSKVPPGEYLLGVNLDGLNSAIPYPPSFYPGVSERQLARTVKIEGPQTIENLDFSIEDRRPTRQIIVKVIWPDGRRVTNASIDCKESSSDGTRSADFVWRYTDAKGQAICDVLAERDFEVEVNSLSWSASGRPVEPVETRPKVPVKANGGPAYITIAVDKINDISDREAPSDMSSFNDPQ